ncbi:hypothetical protein HYU13_02520 [Candidatus Woesearchaeota archaeon]|nr:hypothetical protein [Candidatus Woesearchaeota archaeon]
MKKEISILALAVVLGALAGALSSYSFLILHNPSQKELIRDFYLVENAVHISPHGVRKAMDKGDSSIVLVDLRSEQEYLKEHIIGAVNIPAYKDPDTSAYGDVDRIVSSFLGLQDNNPGKDIVVYCYSMPCMTGRKIGQMLAEHGIFVKHLTIGWNEWRHFWTLWNHEHEWNATLVKDYIAKGKEPGKPKSKMNLTACPIDNEFGC